MTLPAEPTAAGRDGPRSGPTIGTAAHVPGHVQPATTGAAVVAQTTEVPMKGILTKDITNQKFWLVVSSSGAVFGARLEKGVYALLQKLESDVAVLINEDGKITIGGRFLGHLVGWNGQPTTPDPNNAWTIRTRSGSPGRLGRSIQRAVRDGTLDRTQAVAWVRKYLGDAAKELEELLEDSSTSSKEEELLELLKRHLIDHDEEGDLPPW